MLIPAIVINHATPAISVTNQDSGVPAVTYNQIKQSLGAQVYKVTGLNMYSTNINQLMGNIQYQIFDSAGNQNYTSITNTIDPYAGNVVSIDVDLSRYTANFILNGNSSLATTILPLTNLKVQFYTSRITNAFGDNLENFKQIEVDANKPHFYNNYGSDISNIQSNSLALRDQIGIPSQSSVLNMTGGNKEFALAEGIQTPEIPLFMMSIAAISIGFYLLKRK